MESKIKSKKDAIAFVKGIKDCEDYAVGDAIAEDNAAVLSFIFKVYYTPTEDSPKVPLDHIIAWFIGKDSSYGTRNVSFRYTTSAGDEDTFPMGQSGIKAPGARPNRADKVRAMRSAIDHQICEWRDANERDKNATCQECKQKLGLGALEIDHVTRFAELVSKWVVSVDGMDNVRVGDDGGVLSMTDADQQASWDAFHAANAELRYLHAACNRKRG